MEFKRTKLAVALATTITLIGCGGGDGGVAAVGQQFVNNAINLPNLGSQQGNLQNLINNIQASSSTFSLSALVNPTEAEQQTARDVADQINQILAIWQNFEVWLNGQSNNKKSQIMSTDDYVSALTIVTLVQQDIQPLINTVANGGQVETDDLAMFDTESKLATRIAERKELVQQTVDNQVREITLAEVVETSRSSTLREETRVVVSDPDVVSIFRDYTESVDGATETVITTYRETTVTTTTYTRTYQDIYSVTTVIYGDGSSQTAEGLESTTLVSEVPDVITDVTTEVINVTTVPIEVTVVSTEDVVTTETETVQGEPELQGTNTDTRADGSIAYYFYWKDPSITTTTTTTTRVTTYSDNSTTEEVINTQVETTTTYGNQYVTVQIDDSNATPPDGNPDGNDNGSGAELVQPDLDFDPATYNAATYYNSEYMGTPTDVASHNPDDYRTSEFDVAKDAINAEYAYARGWTGKGSTIMIMDSGIDTDHPDLQSKIKYTWDPGYDDGHEDTLGHGTHVAGIAAAIKNDSGVHGVAYDADLAVARITDRGFGYSYALQALAWASDKADIVVANLSANTTYNADYKNSITNQGNGIYTSNHIHYGGANYYNLEDPQSWANVLPAEMVITVAAGNSGLDYVQNPATFATAVDGNGNLLLGGRMMVVGSWDANSNVISSFSNKAGHVCKDYTNGTCNDPYLTKDFYILAPGSSINSTTNDGDYGTMSGTSMAAPAVAGAVAIVHQLWPYMKGANIAQLLFQTADKTIAGYDANVHGQGLLDLDRATRPVGDLQIALDGRTGTTQVLSGVLGGVNLEGQSLSALQSVSAVDDFDRDYTVNLEGSTTADNVSQPVAYNEHTSGQGWSSKFAGRAVKVENFDVVLNEATGNVSLGIGTEVGERTTAKLTYTHTKHDPWVNFDGMWGDVERADTIEASVTHKFENKEFYVQGGVMATSTEIKPGIIRHVDETIAAYAVAGWEKQEGHNSFKVYGGVKPHALSGGLDMKVPDYVDSKGTMHYQNVRADLNDEVTGFLGANYNFAKKVDNYKTHSFNASGVVDTQGDALVQVQYKMTF